MSVPLATATQAPVRYCTFSFGGDDRQKHLNPLLKHLVLWEMDIKRGQGNVFQQGAVCVAKKIFESLDRMGLGYCFFGYGGFKSSVELTEYYLTAPQRNAAAREKIVAALNTDITTVPVLQLSANDLTDYLKLQDRHFERGQWLIQGEDPAGRKFVAMRLQDRNGQVEIATIHQRYRETRISYPGSFWTLNFAHDVNPGDMERITTFITQIRNNIHPTLSAAIK